MIIICLLNPSDKLDVCAVLREERKSKDKIVPLEVGFWGVVSRQLQALEIEKKSIAACRSTKYMIVDDEIRTLREAVRQIIRLRLNKLFKEIHTCIQGMV